MTARAVAAILGSYALAAMFAFAAARVLPMQKVEAMTTATLLSFLLVPVGAIWAFCAASALRAWARLVVPVMAMGGLAWLVGPPL